MSQPKKAKEFLTSVPGTIAFGDYCVVTKYSDGKGFKISTDMLAELCLNAKRSGQKPLLIVSIKKNEIEMYVLKCQIEVTK